MVEQNTMYRIFYFDGLSGKIASAGDQEFSTPEAAHEYMRTETRVREVKEETVYLVLPVSRIRFRKDEKK